MNVALAKKNLVKILSEDFNIKMNRIENYECDREYKVVQKSFLVLLW